MPDSTQAVRWHAETRVAYWSELYDSSDDLFVEAFVDYRPSREWRYVLQHPLRGLIAGGSFFTSATEAMQAAETALNGS